jgi:hypothetical protein
LRVKLHTIITTQTVLVVRWKGHYNEKNINIMRAEERGENSK